MAPALWDDGSGVRGTDFAAATTGVLGRKQCCWAHPQAADVQGWATALRTVSDHGQDCTRQDLRPAQRERA